MSIQRFEGATAPDGKGRYVLYADHVETYNKAAMNAYLYITTKADQKLAEEVAQIILEACR